MNMNDLFVKVSHFQRIQKIDLSPYATACSSIDSCYSPSHQIPSNSLGSAVSHPSGSITGISPVLVLSRPSSDNIQISSHLLP